MLLRVNYNKLENIIKGQDNDLAYFKEYVSVIKTSLMYEKGYKLEDALFFITQELIAKTSLSGDEIHNFIQNLQKGE